MGNFCASDEQVIII